MLKYQLNAKSGLCIDCPYNVVKGDLKEQSWDEKLYD